jgi:hypothetical protein
LVTRRVLEMMGACPYEICRKRLENMLLIKKGVPKLPSVPKKRRKQIRTPVVTKGNLPKGFKRIGN